ncbi:Arm DNA-binding domain-containing protein, partial [Sphingopyxis sp.]|uniref:Arm DNA-binding domain-containing protein n=1 Tax=Sphingopyxis sp. TaxID=1908224 RepID=UPI002ED85B7D
MNRLFATTVANAKSRDRDYKLTDGDGLFLLVRPNGSKLWRMNYKYLGRYRTLSFGAWPEVSLADARGKREDARRQIAAGLDPSHERKLEQARAVISEDNNFRLVAEEWVEKNEREGMAEITLSKIRWL